jgi:hypothetical protein
MAGAAAAFLVGSVAVLVGGTTDQLRALLTSPAIVVLGLAVASLLGAALSPRAVGSRWVVAIAIAVAYGLVVPVIVAALIALPLAPIAAMFAPIAWPVTVTAAVAWLALIRWDRTRRRLASVPSVGAATILATVLLALRFTQPNVTASSATGQCVSFPGERIETIAWSPDGAWLGVGSERDGGGIVRVIEQPSGKIIELARGPYVDAASSGVAVGPGGATTYLVNVQGASARPEDEGATLWVASPTDAAHLFAVLPTPGISDLTWTPDGIAAVQWVDPATWTETHRLVWVGLSAASVFEAIEPEVILEHPVLAPLVMPSAEAAMTIRTPSGEKIVDPPSDASGEISVTIDGRYLVFNARALTEDQVDEKYNHVVAESTVDGGRVVLASEPGWTPKVAAGRVAYLTFPAYPDNSVCVKDAAIP